MALRAAADHQLHAGVKEHALTLYLSIIEPFFGLPERTDELQRIKEEVSSVYSCALHCTGNDSATHAQVAAVEYACARTACYRAARVVMSCVLRSAFASVLPLLFFVIH